MHRIPGLMARLPGALALLLLAAAPALAQSDPVLVGLTDLQARLGLATPTGAGVVVGQVEVPGGGPGGATEYAPNPDDAEFVGKTFTFLSGDPTTSGHANFVAYDFYGLSTSIAPGIPAIFCWEAGNWATTGFLKCTSPSTVMPAALPGPIKIFNHSWIGAFENPAINNACIRRADFVTNRDNTLMCVGMDNTDGGGSGSNPALMSHMYNGLAVGVRDGAHTHATTISGLDGTGRHKPEIVAPGDATSWSTPVVSAAAALLTQTARTAPLSSNPSAERSEVLKGALLAGAKKEAAHGAPWTNNPVTSGPNRGVTSVPLDLVVGAGTVNINNSHLILTGNQWAGAPSVPLSTNAGYRGWDKPQLNVKQSRYYRFNVHETATAVSIVATWHRRIPTTLFGTFFANVDLILWRVNPGETTLQTLVGPPGLTAFTGGNVVSQSTLENIEHLYISGLAPGQYVLEVKRLDTLTTQTNWDVAVAWLFPTPAPLVGDINGDGIVNGIDLALLLAAWTGAASYTPCPPFAPADFNHDCKTNGLDLAMLLSNWG